MEESKIILTLSQYDEFKKKEFLLNEIKNFLLSYAELEDGKMKLDYNLRYSNILTKVIQKNFPEDYQKRLNELKEEEK